MNELHLMYKCETGNCVNGNELSVIKLKNGNWVANWDYHNTEDLIETFGFTGTIQFPDLEYINWLENKIKECMK